MPLDPTHPGAMPEATLTITTTQARRLSQLVEDHLDEHRLGGVRLEKLADAWLRVVLVGPPTSPASGLKI
jgi:hypothetical protein